MIGIGVGLAIAIAAAIAITHRPSLPRPDDAGALHVPRSRSAVVIDGETNDDAWLAPPGPARTGAFHFSSGAPARPYSEARFVWHDAFLYVALYAADEDIRARTDKPDGPLWIDDAFRVTLTRGADEWIIEVSPKCVVTDGKRRGGRIDYSWQSGVRVGCDTDGTINDASDADEEWVVEMAIPLAAIGVEPRSGESFGLSIERCDTPKSSPRVCAFWGENAHGRIVLM